MLLLSSPLLRQAESTSGSRTMAARRDNPVKCKDPNVIPLWKLDARDANGNSQTRQEQAPARRHWGCNGRRAGPVTRWTRRGNVDRTASSGDQSAPVVMVPVMTMVEVPAVMTTMMTPPMGVGIHHFRAERCGLDHRHIRRLVGRSDRRRRQKGNGQQGRGNRFRHFVLLQGDRRDRPLSGSPIVWEDYAWRAEPPLKRQASLHSSR